MQTTVARSSAEAKYHALAHVVAEFYWILKLFRQLQISLSSPPRLLCDKNNAIFIASSSMTKSCSKNIDIDYHFIRKLIAQKVIGLSFVTSHLQLVNVFTKRLARLQFLLDRGKLFLFPPRQL